jgi:hypothetical protein
MENKTDRKKLKDRIRGNKAFCSYHNKYHPKEKFYNAKVGCKLQGWCKDAMRGYIKKWKVLFKERHGGSYG